MKWLTYSILSIFLLLSSITEASKKSDIYSAFIKSDLISWKTTIDKMQNKNNLSTSELIELINYQYGYIGWCLRDGKNTDAEKYLKTLNDNITKLNNQKYNIAIVNAYKSAYYGFLVRSNRLKAPYYGPKSVSYANKASESSSKNWFITLQLANIQYYMPSVFGGSKSDAIKLYLKAKTEMEKENNLVNQNWNYLNVLVTIAEAYTSLSLYDHAEVFYKKILKIEPNFTLVKNKLYPQLKEKIKAQQND